MRRTLPLLLVATLLLAANSPARAGALETGGEFRARFWSLDDYLRDGAGADLQDQRLRLTMTWPVTPTVRVQARADLLEGFWGDPLPSAPPPAPAERPQVEFDQVNLQFVLPGAPLRLTVGRQDVTWGTGFWVREDNRDRLQVAARLASTVIVVAWDKFTEVASAHGQRYDWDAFAVGAVTTAPGFTLGLLAAYTQDGSRSVFPKGDLAYAAASLFASGTAGPVDLKTEVVYGEGGIDRDDGSRLDLGGLGGYAGAFVPVGGRLTVGLEGAYVRGDDPKTTDRNEGFFAADYHGPCSSLVLYNAMDVPGYAGDLQTSDPGKDTSIRNAAVGKLSVAYALSSDLSVTGAALYAAADRVAEGAGKVMGWEFDLTAVYGITERVSLSAGVGYALLGDYWRTAPIAGGTGGKPDDPLVAVVAFTAKL